MGVPLLKKNKKRINKWVVKNGFAYVLTFFSLISDGLGGVGYLT